MDGLHKLKTPGLYASLFFQATSIYLLFQATNLRSHSYLQEGLTRRTQRDAQVPMESPMRAQEIQCSEGLAAYQWGAIGSILLSIGCLSPLMMRNRKEERGGFFKTEKTPTSQQPSFDTDHSSVSEGAWLKEPSVSRRTETRDNVYRRDTGHRPVNPGLGARETYGSNPREAYGSNPRESHAAEGAWMKEPARPKTRDTYATEGAWMKDTRRNESAYLSETHRSETFRTDGSLRSETHRSEAAYRSSEGWGEDLGMKSAAVEPALDAAAYKSLKKGLEELELYIKNQPPVMTDSALVRTVGDNVRLLETRNRNTYESLLAGHDEIQKATARLQRLMEQCRESANYAATNRVDWKKNKLVDILTQMRQNLDTVVDLSKNINSIHASTLRMLGESMHSESILNEKINRAQEQLERIQSNAHNGTKAHDTMINIIGESRDNITGASKFVGSLGQKWDAIVNMTEELDEVADKINQQTLAASLEISRGGNNQNVKDLFPLGTELRGLAATFHTYARQVKDAIHGVRDEMSKTNSYLSQAGAKADLAFVSVSQCGQYYRSSVNAVKHSTSELVLLQQEVNIHMKKLQDARSMGQTSADLLGNLDRHLQGHNGFGMKIMDETSQITVHSEKISTLLAKQYHELNHSTKMLGSSAPLLTDSIRFTMESTQTISTLAGCLERAQISDEGSGRDMPRQDDVVIAKIESFKQLVASLKDPGSAGSVPALETSASSSVMKQRPLAVQPPRSPAPWRVMN